MIEKQIELRKEILGKVSEALPSLERELKEWKVDLIGKYYNKIKY